MIERVDIAALARLARLEVPEAELATLEKQLPEILAFVAHIQEAVTETPAHAPALRNVMREDGQPHETGLHTETLLAAAPAREGNRVAVKQVISRKK